MDELALVSMPRPGVAQITLNRPEVLNALNHDSLRRLQDLLGSCEADPEIRVLVITGAGRAFSAGLDMKSTGFATGAENLGRVPRVHRNQEAFAALILRVVRLTKPVIAAVGGAAVGAGFGLALACDIRVASETAYFSAPFVKLGLSAGDVGLSWLLPRTAGLSNSMDILLTSRQVDATDAQQMGIVSRVYPSDEYLDEALKLAEDLGTRDDLALRLSKRALWANSGPIDLCTAIELENRTQTLAAMNDIFYQARDRFADGSDASDAPENGLGR